MINYHDAFDIICDELSEINLDSETVDINSSIGRTLAEDVYSDINLPPFDNSAVDGFAVKFNEDISTYKIQSEISAGHFDEISVIADNCISIMTGARMPFGAEAVIPIEDIIQNNDEITLKNGIQIFKGMNVRFCGEDLEKGCLAMKSGNIIRTNNIHLLASCGKNNVKVKKKIKIGVFSTGDELVPIHTAPENDKIRSSNLVSLLTLIDTNNFQSIDYGIISDKLELIELKLKDVLNDNIDILITSGGVSVGKYDFLKEAIENVGAKVLFWKANIKPGKPILFSIFNNGIKKIPIFSLPGNPLSSFVNFKIFIELAIDKIQKTNNDKIFTAKVTQDIKKNDSKLHFVLANYNYDFISNHYEVNKSGSQSSGRVSVLNVSNCLIFFPEKLEKLSDGDFVKCMKI